MSEKFDAEFVIKVMKLYKLKKILFECRETSKIKTVKLCRGKASEEDLDFSKNIKKEDKNETKS